MYLFSTSFIYLFRIFYELNYELRMAHTKQMNLCLDLGLIFRIPFVCMNVFQKFQKKTIEI